MRKIQISALALFATALVTGAASCSHKKVNFGTAESTVSNEKDGLEVSVVWLKNKGDTIDLLVTMRNHYKVPVGFKKTAVKLAFNGQQGIQRKNEFSGDMLQGTLERGLLIFDFEPKLGKAGRATLSIDPITTEGAVGARKSVAPLKIELPVDEQ